MGDFAIEAWPGDAGDPRFEDDVDRLAEVLHASVQAGASVSFILPFALDEARAWWHNKVVPAVRSGGRRVLVARVEGRIAGTVQVDLATPPNQRHRAEVVKLLVDPEFRRRGIARALMVEVEEVARRERRTLLTLDTRAGDRAERLYLSLGYVEAGRIPGYARGPGSEELEPTCILYKVVSW